MIKTRNFGFLFSDKRNTYPILASPMLLGLLAMICVEGFAQDNFYVSGNLGVGTDAPQRAVHLQGRNAVFRMDCDGGTAAFLLVRTKPDDFDTIWKSYVVGVDAKRSGDGEFVINDLGTAVGGAGTRRLTISNVGYVGIGTHDPQGLLDVNGSIFQRGELRADYVFEPGFDLETIEAHADYMWKHKHLKAIPRSSKDEAGADVVEIGAHRRGIVEELEKAHIYIAQLNRENKLLEEKSSQLEKQLATQKEHHVTMLALKTIICEHNQDEPLCLGD